MNVRLVIPFVVGELRHHVNLHLKGVHIPVGNTKGQDPHALVHIVHVVYIVFYLVLQLQFGAVCYGVFHVQLVHLVALNLYHTFTPLFYQPHMAQL